MNDRTPVTKLPTEFSDETQQAITEALRLLLAIESIQHYTDFLITTEKLSFPSVRAYCIEKLDDRLQKMVASMDRLDWLLDGRGQTNVLRRLHKPAGVEVGEALYLTGPDAVAGIAVTLWTLLACSVSDDDIKQFNDLAYEGAVTWDTIRPRLPLVLWEDTAALRDVSEVLEIVLGDDGKILEKLKLTLEQDQLDIAEQICDTISPEILAPGEGHNKPEAEHAEYGHSEDFRSVVFDGVTYEFTTIQAAIVQVLWDEWGNCTPAVSVPTLIERSGSRLSSNRLSDLFREAGPNKSKVYHPAWGAMIVQSTRGAYRLAGICPENLKNPQNPR